MKINETTEECVTNFNKADSSDITESCMIEQ